MTRDASDEPTDRNDWHRIPAESVLEALDSRRAGLDRSEADGRLERHGPNRVGERREISPWQVLLHQFQSPLIYVLLGALVATVATSLATGEGRWSDAIVIGIVLVVNGTVGFLQEYRAESAVEELMKMVAPKASVLRGGDERRIPAESLVPGDVVLLDEGGVVPADLRLIEVGSLQVNEAALTGESVPADKTDAAMENADRDLPPSERSNMAFMGTSVTSGSAVGVVVATGERTEIGRIAEQMGEAREVETPLQRRIQRLAVWITWGILVIAAIAFGVGLLMGRDWSRMITLAVALAVAAIPAGLPIVVTVALAIGVRRMAKHDAVIRHLPAVDTLGSCTTIVSDKTGTLTQNRMAVRAILAGGQRYDVEGGAHSRQGRLAADGDAVEVAEHPALYQALVVGVLCNDAVLPDERAHSEAAEKEDAEALDASGDPMEVALLYAGLKAGLGRHDLRERYPLTDEIPFRTEQRYMATVHDVTGDSGPGPGGEAPLALVKGAPEAVAAMCRDRLGKDGEAQSIDVDEVLADSEALAGEGLRVLAMAVGQGDEVVRGLREGEPPRELTLVGLQGMLDPPRPSAIEAVDACHGAGIRVIMVTGDHATTAAAIAREVHVDRPVEALATAARHGDDGAGSAERGAANGLPESTIGRDVTDMADDELDRVLERVDVYARFQPVQKTRVVERLKAADHVVAVTGDGVNDAPALEAAHIGAAMGSGTDVAKEASDMVITDDDFASVYRAVEQGRTAFRNIRMATFFLLSTGAAMVLVILTALGLNWPLPFLPAQILWCNVVTNGIADVALAFEPGEPALYRRPPRPPSEGVLDRTLIERLVLVGIWLAVGTLAVFLWKWDFDFATWQGDDEQLTLARTAALTTMVLFQKFHLFNCRSEDVSIFRKGLWANRILLLGALTSLAVHVAAVYMVWGQQLLSLTALDWFTWLIALLVASTAIAVNELHKRFRPRFR